MYDHWELELMLPLSNGFFLKTTNTNASCLDRYKLLDKDVLYFTNRLSLLVDTRKNKIPKNDWEILARTLNNFMVTHQNGELYYYLLHAHGPDAIKYNAWVHFASDTDWSICVRTFTDMPTKILEEYADKEWHNRTRRMSYKDIEVFLKAINKRTDIYGNDSLPLSMVEGILFDK